MTNTPGDSQPEQQPEAPYGEAPPPPPPPPPAQPGYWEQQASQQAGYQQPYPQQGYQPGYQQPYAQPYPPQYAYGVRPNHPSANTAMVLGIVGLALGFTCGLGFLVSPFAWVTGSKAVREIDASAGQLDGRSSAQAGKIMGIVGTVFLILALLALALVVVVAFAGTSTSTVEDNPFGALRTF